MSAMDRRELLFGGILLGGAAAAAVARPPAATLTISADQLDQSIPLTVGRYRFASAAGAVLPPRDELSDRIYDRYVARAYVAPGLPPIMLVVAYGGTQDYGLQLHRPESCYPASGYAIGPSRQVPVAVAGRSVAAVTLSADKGGRRDQILYWTRIGSEFPASLWGGRLAILRDALTRDIPDGVIVRLSTPGDDPVAALQALTGFNAALMARLGTAGRRILLGPSA